jgi:hypothetical protein
VTQAKEKILTLYYREGCHLCEDMAFSLRELIAGTGWTLIRIDIDSNEPLRQRFNADVPVLCLGEDIICRHFLDRERLARFLGEDY